MTDYEDNEEEEFKFEELNDSGYTDKHWKLQLMLFKDCCVIRRPPHYAVTSNLLFKIKSKQPHH